jgi:hypothetical protein
MQNSRIVLAAMVLALASMVALLAGQLKNVGKEQDAFQAAGSNSLAGPIEGPESTIDEFDRQEIETSGGDEWTTTSGENTLIAETSGLLESNSPGPAWKDDRSARQAKRIQEGMIAVEKSPNYETVSMVAELAVSSILDRQGRYVESSSGSVEYANTGYDMSMAINGRVYQVSFDEFPLLRDLNNVLADYERDRNAWSPSQELPIPTMNGYQIDNRLQAEVLSLGRRAIELLEAP